MILKKCKALFIITLICTMYSCSQGQVDKKEIIGKWKATEYNANIKDLSPDIIRGAKEIALSSSYEFKSDNTYSFSSNTETYNGKWGVENNTISMTFSSEYERNGEEKYEVVNWNNGEMTWKSDFDSGKIEIVLSKMQ